MSKSDDWNLVLSLNEFILYLDQNDVIDLSSLSKRLRNKLKPVIFKALKLDKYPLLPIHSIVDSELTDVVDEINDQLETLSINNTENNISNLQAEHSAPTGNIEDDSIMPITSTDSIIQQFKDDLSQFNPYTTHLNVFGYVKHFFIEEVALRLNGLQYLDLSLILIPFNSLVCLLNTLSSLRYLRVNSIRAFKFNNQPNIDDEFSFPNTLKELYWEECFVYTTELDGDPFTFNYHSLEQDLLSDEALELTPQLLPNLTHLTYHSFDSNSQIITEFLSLNPQIRSMECIYFGPILFTLISLLESFRNCTQVKLEFYLSTPDDISTYNFPTLPSISTLIFEYFDSLGLGIIYKICANCPNLTNLSTIYYATSCDLFNKLLNNIPKLKKLTLINEINVKWLLELNPHPELECLNLKNFKQSNMDFNSFNNFPKLKTITFTVEGIDSIRNQWNKNYIESITDWKIIHFPNCIKCYKIT